MGRRDDDQDVKLSVTDLDAIESNAESAVIAFSERFISAPRFTERCQVMDQAQLRDAMGLRATFESGDPWPKAEQLLLKSGFRWHVLGGMRVMYLMERDDFLPDTGWEEAEKIDTD